jgi:hypothetical protein
MNISNFETGNPPEGWESEGQFRNAEFHELPVQKKPVPILNLKSAIV